MASFSEGFWDLFIFICSVGGILALFLFVKRYAGPRPPGETVQTMGHKWDDDLEELNNPLPSWWLNLFYITLVFGIVYLLLYPGVGSHSMLLGWTQVGQYEEEMAAAEARYGPLFEKYVSQDIVAVSRDPQAKKMGRRLFVNYCAQCHGSDAGGSPGFPNLRDDVWQYGGDPEAIKTTILKGRNGVMPPWGEALGEDGVKNVTQYVLQLNARQVDEAAAKAGEAQFKQLCAACHQADGSGNQELGAPNLTNNVWLYGGSPKAVEATIANGRQGQMPPHEAFLGEAKVHILAAYVYGLSRE